MDFADRLVALRLQVADAAARSGRSPDSVRIIGVTKTVTVDRIVAAVRAGLTDLGENRWQEAAPKIAALHASGLTPCWHFIGALQSNKARAVADAFSLIHSIDSVRLAEAINQRATRVVPVLLEVNVAGEPTKAGFRLSPDAPPFADALAAIRALPRLAVRGLMTVAPFVADPEAARPVFAALANLAAQHALPDLSMGMTNDFPVAIEEGATMIRVGRALFGDRLA